MIKVKRYGKTIFVDFENGKWTHIKSHPNTGGDNNASKMYLVNLQKLFSSDVIKAFKELEDE